MKNTLTITLIVIIACFYSKSYADSINSRTDLKPKSRVRVNKALAKSYVPLRKNYGRKSDEHTSIQRGSVGSNRTSASSIQTINSFSNVRYAPREVVTSVQGDIINICFHCR
ncbi:MAG: hypothetical protein KAH08_02035 [Methylococcales bacterium]|nr:hypothetical protein [Methylococcales bacterium]